MISAAAHRMTENLGGRFGYVYFFCSGEGKRARDARKGVGGVGFLVKIPGGGFSQQRGGGGADGPGGCLRGIGGEYIFLFGAETPTKKH